MRNKVLLVAISMLLATCGRQGVGTGSYVWYPGQWAAHRQEYQKAVSVSRCVNVDYPGVYFSPAYRTWFRNTAEAGKLYLMETDDRLPCLWVDGRTDGWEASLDSLHWAPVETDIRFSNKERRPDERMERVVRYCPDKEIWDGNRYLVDFGVLELGQVCFRLKSSDIVHVYVGESQEEALCVDPTLSEQAPLPSIQTVGQWQEIKLPERALRYCLLLSDGPFEVQDMVLSAMEWPVEQLLHFSCSDSLLTRMFEVGAATIHTSMHNFYLDGVKRDYLPWAMDAVETAFGGDYLFGDRLLSRSGVSIALMDETPSTQDWGVADYPLHALIGLEQTFLRYADTLAYTMFADRVRKQLELYESIQDENGFIHDSPESWGFIPGWTRTAGPEQHGAPTYAQMMLYLNFKIAASRADFLGLDSQHYQQKAALLSSNIQRHFWDPKRRVFMNGYDADGRLDRRYSHYAQFWGILTGLFPERDLDQLFTVNLPAIPGYLEGASFEKGYESLAYVRAGRSRELYALLERIWGHWLDEGGVRFPENFTISASWEEQLSFYGRPFGLSLCHGANGVPPVVLALNGVFGFSQEDVHVFRLKPDLMDLCWANGRIPVGNAFIELDLKTEGQSLISIPEGIHVYFISRDGKQQLLYPGTHQFTY